MNTGIIKGYIKDIEYSHTTQGILYDKAKLISRREDGTEDILNLKFKSFSNRYQDNDFITIMANIRSYSYKVNEDKNKVEVYLFTYFDKVDEDIPLTNAFKLDGRICKMNELRTTRKGKHNLHFILANNIISEDTTKRINSYIPCVAWGKLAKELSNLPVNTKLELTGELHSREHKKKLDNNDIEIRVAHEFFIKDYKIID